MKAPTDSKRIPGFPNYSITLDGGLFDHRRNKWMKWHITKPSKKGSIGGYRMVKIIDAMGKKTNIGRHRLLALTYIPEDRDVSELVINHKNGVPGDDRIINLEWVTRQQNNQHAYDSGLKSDSKPILVKNMLTGEVTRYPTIELCARTMGYNSGTFIYWRLNRTVSLKRYPDEIQFKYDDGTPWPEVDWFALRVERAGPAQSYMAFNVHTREMYVFRGLSAGEAIIGVDKGTIAAHVNHGRLLPLNGFIVRYHTETAVFPRLCERTLLICKDHPMKQPNGIIVVDTRDSSEQFFTSSEAAAEALGLGITTVWQYCRQDTLYKKHYRLKLFKIHDVVRSLQGESPECLSF